MQLPRRRFLQLAASTTALLSLKQTARAEDAFPSRPIHLIVGFTPGSASDINARLFAKGAEGVLGQPIVVENKPGAAGSLAGQYVAHAANDGYTLFLFALSTLTNEIVNSTHTFDVTRDFAPVGLLANTPLVLVVSPASNVHNLADLIALAKAKPGDVLSGSTGAGSFPQLAATLFAQRAGIKVTDVPYPGSPQITGDLIAGRITMSFNVTSAMLGQIQAGQLTALATSANKRATALPNVPTMAEAGMADFDTTLWLGLAAPAGTPRPVIEKLADAAKKAMHSPDAVEALGKQGYDPLDADPDAFAAFIKTELARWTEVTRVASTKG